MIFYIILSAKIYISRIYLSNLKSFTKKKIKKEKKNLSKVVFVYIQILSFYNFILNLPNYTLKFTFIYFNFFKHTFCVYRFFIYFFRFYGRFVLFFFFKELYHKSYMILGTTDRLCANWAHKRSFFFNKWNKTRDFSTVQLQQRKWSR